MMDEVFLSKQTASDACTDYCQFIAVIIVIDLLSLKLVGGGTWWRSWLRHRATSRKVAGLIPDGFTGIFH